jgi:hypothetical protein
MRRIAILSGAALFDVTDINDDRRTDVISLGDDGDFSTPGPTVVSFALGDGEFSAPQTMASMTMWAGDLDGDCHSDRIQVLPGWEVVAARHIDEDRRLDLLLRKPRRVIALLSSSTRRSRAVSLSAIRMGRGGRCIRFRARHPHRALRRTAAVIVGDLRVKLGRDGHGSTCDEFSPGLYEA